MQDGTSTYILNSEAKSYDNSMMRRDLIKQTLLFVRYYYIY